MSRDKEKKRLYDQAYIKTSKGKKVHDKALNKYQNSLKGRECKKRYRQSPKYKKYQKRKNRSPEGRASSSKYWKSKKGKDLAKRRWQKYMNSWVESGVIPKKTRCERCQRIIIFNSKNNATSTHFDHKYGGKEIIKGSPNTWLGTHPAAPKNIKVWVSCGFGMLCSECNRSLPTLNRLEWLKKSVKYATDGKYEVQLVN